MSFSLLVFIRWWAYLGKCKSSIIYFTFCWLVSSSLQLKKNHQVGRRYYMMFDHFLVRNISPKSLMPIDLTLTYLWFYDLLPRKFVLWIKILFSRWLRVWKDSSFFCFRIRKKGINCHLTNTRLDLLLLDVSVCFCSILLRGKRILMLFFEPCFPKEYSIFHVTQDAIIRCN